MPLDARYFTSALPGATIPDDAECPKCQYSLRGLRAGGVCPECGTRIVIGRRRSALDDNLTDAPIGYIRTLAVGCWLMAGSAFAGVLLALAGFRTTHPAVIGAAVLAAAGWWAGVFIVSRPRQTSIRSRAELRAEYRRTRLAACVTQGAWFLALGGWLAADVATAAAIKSAASNGTAFVTPPFLTAILVSNGVSYFVAILGLVPLAIVVSNLADWAGNTALADRFRDSTWGLCLGLVAFSIGLPLVTVWRASMPGPLAMVVWVLMILGGLSYLGCGILYLLGLAELAGMSAWAVSNSKSGTERDERVADRAARHAEEMIGRTLQAGATSPNPGSGGAASGDLVASKRARAQIASRTPLVVPPNEPVLPRRADVKPYGVEPEPPSGSGPN